MYQEQKMAKIMLLLLHEGQKAFEEKHSSLNENINSINQKIKALQDAYYRKYSRKNTLYSMILSFITIAIIFLLLPL